MMYNSLIYAYFENFYEEYKMFRETAYQNLLGNNEKEFIRNMALRFPAETKLLSGDMQTSPSITHDLAANFTQEELPSYFLFTNQLLTESKDEVTKYDRKKYMELDRGFAAVIALSQVLRGGEGNYNAFIRGQDSKAALPREQFDAMHLEYNASLYDDNLKIAAIYLAAFNDLGKSTILLKEASQIKGQEVLDHDEANALIVKDEHKRKELLPGLNSLNPAIQKLIGYSIGLAFNASCFTQGEYPFYPVAQIAEALKKVPVELKKAVFSLIKIESAMDVAGARGHQAPGGAVYSKFVHPTFELAFKKLGELLTEGNSAHNVYLSYIEENAKKFGLADSKDQNERVTLVRFALMIRAQNEADGKLIIEAFNKLKQNDSSTSTILINELAINNLAPSSYSIWMQYSPDLLRILAKENKSGQSPIEGLQLGLKIYAQVLSLARKNGFSGPCYMVQGREILPTVRTAASGDKNAMNLLVKATGSNIEIQEGVAKLRNLSTEISYKAKKLYNQLQEVKFENSSEVLSIIKKLSEDNLLPPDDLAFVLETLESLDGSHQYTQFILDHKNEITRQLTIDRRKYTAVPIINFTYQKEYHVLLMKNIGLKFSVDVNEVQWTAPGVRVDADEKELLKEKELWSLYENVSGNDEKLTFMIAAIVRRIKEMGIDITKEEIAKICFINRTEAGFPETSPEYRTEYFDVDLGEQDPAKIKENLSKSSSRYAKWTSCFKLSELNMMVKANELTKPGMSRHTYTLTYQGEVLPIRETSWYFIKALKFIKELEIKPDSLTKDPWQLRNLSNFETAIRWVMQRTDSPVQFTLFSPQNNRLSSAKVHAYAAKAKMDEENLAATSLRPERLVLHVIIAQLTTHITFIDRKQLEELASSLYEKFFEINKECKNTWESIFREMEKKLSNKEYDAEDENRVSELSKIISSSQLDDQHRMIYHLHESDSEIATIIRLHEKFNKFVMEDIITKVALLMEGLKPLERYPLSERMCFGVTGPIASGKSVTEQIIRAILKDEGDKSAAYIGSDEWNMILSAHSSVAQSNFAMHCGNLTLPEAWFIKVLIWKMINRMEAAGSAPNWIHETCNPLAIKAPRDGKTTIFINTADPNNAANRVKTRGDKIGRYVSASAAIGSYRWPWLNFIELLKKADKRISINIIDTDIMYTDTSIDEKIRMNLSTITHVFNEILKIYNLNHFLAFISRGFRVNPAPKNLQEIWLQKPADCLSVLLNELDKLFAPTLNKLSIEYKDEKVDKKRLSDKVTQLYTGIRMVEQRAHNVGIFKNKKKEQKVDESKEISYVPLTVYHV